MAGARAGARPASLGATAVRTLFGSGATISKLRGRVQESKPGPPTAATVHPSSIVRLEDREERHAALEALVGDLELAADEAR